VDQSSTSVKDKDVESHAREKKNISDDPLNASKKAILQVNM
jgi:hypothetical protein